MIPTSAQLELLRTRPHRTNLWLSIYKPDIIFAARVNNSSAAKGMRYTEYDGLVSGSAGYVENGMTCYVGTTPQGRDKGKIRVRSIAGSTIYFAENDYINWADDDYLTIVRYVEPWTVYPRMITGSSNYLEMYKDWDISYTDQNTALGSFINMGGHYAGFIDNATGTVYYTASGTYNLNEDTLSFEWFFQGAVITGSTAHTPGYIPYTTPGHYITRLRVTASGSSYVTTDVSYREVSIYNRPEQGNTTPILQWRFNSINGSRDQGGYTANITVWEDVAESSVMDDALVVIFADDYYGNTKQSIGGNALNRDSIVFCGYIMDGSIEYNWRDKSVSFEVGSPTERLKVIPGLSMYVQSSADPSTEPANNEDIPSSWLALLDMDCRRAIYYYLRWHTTALMTNDFEFRGTDQKIKYFDPDSASIYDIINSFMEDTLIGKFVCDRQGKFWAEVDVKAIDNATGTIPTNFVLQKHDWINPITIEERNIQELYYLEMGGFAFAGMPAGTSTPYLACAPGDNLAVEGDSDVYEGLALASQDHLNTLVGNVYAYRNAKYPNIDIELAGNYRVYDIAPQEQIPLTIAATDNNRRIVWTNKHFYPLAMTLGFDGNNEALRSTITLHEVTQGFPGDTIIIPETPPDDGDYIHIPDYNFPDIPVVPIPTGTIIPPAYPADHPNTVFVAGFKYIGTGNGDTDTDSSKYIHTLAKTTNFNSPSPSWTEVLPSNVSGTLIDCSFNPLFPDVQCWWMTTYGLWEIAGLQHTTGTFASCILTNAQATALTNWTGSVGLSRVVASPIEDGQSTIFVLAHIDGDTSVAPRRHWIFKADRVGAGAWTALPSSAGVTPNGNAGQINSNAGGFCIHPYTKTTFLFGIGLGNVKLTQDGGSIIGTVLDTANYYAPSDIYIPRSSYNTVYVVDGEPEAVFRSTASGLSGTFSDISPNVSGSCWGANHGVNRTCKITSTNINSLQLNATFENDNIGMKQGLFTSDDAGTTWQFRKYIGGFDQGTNSKNCGLITHPYDINKLYLRRPVGDEEIGVSSDRGLTWTDKQGTWHTTFGCSPSRSPLGAPFIGLIFPVF